MSAYIREMTSSWQYVCKNYGPKARVNRWVLRCFLKVTVFVSSCIDVGRLFQACWAGETETPFSKLVTGALKSRDLTTRHQIKQIATGRISVGPRKNPTCWTISDCHDSTAALIVACSFCVQSAILSALIRSPYTRGSTTTATAARTKTRTGRRLCQQRQLQARRNRQRQPRQQPRTTVAKCASWRHVLASHWCRADIEHVDRIQLNKT